MNKLAQRSLLNALGTIAYISIVATLMLNGQQIFGATSKILGTIAFLMLFVLSAAMTGGLILGKPLLMYLNNQKKEAVQLFIYTVGWLALAIIILLLVNVRWH